MNPLDVPTGSGPPLPDADVLDEHRLRRARLSAALCRGAAPPRRGAGWPPVVAGVVLTLVALGGTAVGATVHRHLPRTAFSAPAAGAGGAEVRGGVDDDVSRSGPRRGPSAERADDDAVARGTSPAGDTAHPYGPWLGQISSHTAR